MRGVGRDFAVHYDDMRFSVDGGHLPGGFAVWSDTPVTFTSYGVSSAQPTELPDDREFTIPLDATAVDEHEVRATWLVPLRNAHARSKRRAIARTSA